jgi:hypothetical protein
VTPKADGTPRCIIKAALIRETKAVSETVNADKMEMRITGLLLKLLFRAKRLSDYSPVIRRTGRASAL